MFFVPTHISTPEHTWKSSFLFVQNTDMLELEETVWCHRIDSKRNRLCIKCTTFEYKHKEKIFHWFIKWKDMERRREWVRIIVSNIFFFSIEFQFNWNWDVNMENKLFSVVLTGQDSSNWSSLWFRIWIRCFLGFFYFGVFVRFSGVTKDQELAFFSDKTQIFFARHN